MNRPIKPPLNLPLSELFIAIVDYAKELEEYSTYLEKEIDELENSLIAYQEQE